MPQQVRTDGRVGTHGVPLAVAERAGLGEDRVRYRHLPDVVQPATELHPQYLVRGQAEAAGDRGGQLGDLLAVCGQVALPQVAAERERLGDVQALGLLGAQVALIEFREPPQDVAPTALGRVKGAICAVDRVLHRTLTVVQERNTYRNRSRQSDARA